MQQLAQDQNQRIRRTAGSGSVGHPQATNDQERNSWQRHQLNFNELLAYCMDFTQTMLRDSGEFYPFGAVLSPEETVVAIGGDDGNEHPKPQEIYQLLTRAFVSEAKSGKILGAALAANVNVPEQYESRSRDALRVRLETEGFACLVYVPYEITKSGAPQ
jgi:hypothetical protein